MKSRLLAGRWAILACLSMVALPPLASSAEVVPSVDSVTAVWKVQQVNFVYRGYHSFYTCTGLREKLTVILRTLGARDGLTLTAYDCEDGTGQLRFQITLESPIEATPENVRALTDYDSKEKLVALARSEPLPAAEDLPRFAAQWKTVSFARNRKMRLEAGDCHLVQQISQQILPKLSVQILSDNLFCSRAFRNIGVPRLEVAALVAR